MHKNRDTQSLTHKETIIYHFLQTNFYHRRMSRSADLIRKSFIVSNVQLVETD